MLLIHPKLVMVPDPLLREKCIPVFERLTSVDEIDDLIKTMREVLTSCRECGYHTVSIAAPQVGVKLRVFIIDSTAIQLIAINPTITKLSGEQQSIEGCLSFPPGVRFTLKRANIVKFHYTGLDGADHVAKFHDLYAAIVQHACDHLEGKLIDDRLYD